MPVRFCVKLLMGAVFVAAAAMPINNKVAFAQSTSTGKSDATPQTTPKQGASNAQFVASNWNVACQPNNVTKKMLCELFLAISVVKTRQLLMRISITAAPSRMIMQLPHGLSLKAGAKLQIDREPEISVDIVTSSPKGVFTNNPISADLLAKMKSGKKITISVFANNGKRVTIPISLNEFAIAYEKLK